MTKHRSAQKRAREAFIQAASSKRVRRALNHNVGSSGDVQFLNGDKVFCQGYEETESHGVVIGQDGHIVLLCHKSSWIRVHPSRLQLQKEDEIKVPDGDSRTIDNQVSQANSDEEIYMDSLESQPEVHKNETTAENNESRTDVSTESVNTDNDLVAENRGDTKVQSQGARSGSKQSHQIQPKNWYNKAMKFTELLEPDKIITTKWVFKPKLKGLQ